MLKLHSDRFWISPWVFSAYVTLKEKGMPFEVVELALDQKETRKPEYQRATLTAKVPALEHDGFWLAESAAVIEYLEEAYPSPSVFPADIKQRARARQLMSFLRTDLFALREERSTHYMFYAHNDKPLSDKARDDVNKLFAVADAMIPVSGEWCIADSELAFCLQRLAMNGDELPRKLADYAAAQWQRPSVQEYVSHARPTYVSY
jgi:glutathione S-transferase